MLIVGELKSINWRTGLHQIGYSMLQNKHPPPKRCIFHCSSSADEPRGDEHIIPLSLGGKAKIPLATCKSCERITSKFEHHCAEKMLRPAITHLGIRGRAKVKRTNLPVRVGESPDSQRLKIPLSDHPGMLWMFIFSVPTILLGINSAEPPVGRLFMRPLHADIARRLDSIRLRHSKFNLINKPFDAPQFARLLAKIAHCYLVAELGLDGFKPLLPRIILNDKEDDHLLNYVGTHPIRAATCKELHSISYSLEKSTNDEQYYVVHIRLFAQQDTPTHYVVTGLPVNGVE